VAYSAQITVVLIRMGSLKVTNISTKRTKNKYGSFRGDPYPVCYGSGHIRAMDRLWVL
jgi:Ribonuclease G/E